MLALLGFLTIIVLLVLVISKRLSVLLSLILVPILFALIGGFAGDTLTLSLIPYKKEDCVLLCEEATAEKVKHHLEDVVWGEVVRYERPNIAALQFCLPAGTLGRCHHQVSDGHARQNTALCPPGNRD